MIGCLLITQVVLQTEMLTNARCPKTDDGRCNIFIGLRSSVVRHLTVIRYLYSYLTWKHLFSLTSSMPLLLSRYFALCFLPFSFCKAAPIKLWTVSATLSTSAGSLPAARWKNFQS